MPTASPILEACIKEFRKTKAMAESAFAQLAEEQFHARINPHQNSIAVIIQHLRGNMLSRFTDFLTTDGEKPSRDREGEFTSRQQSRDELLALWNEGWNRTFVTLESLTDADLQRAVTIRTEPHTVFQAINRQTAHFAFHTAQILLIAKHLLGDDWKYITIAPGQSAAFNASKGVQ